MKDKLSLEIMKLEAHIDEPGRPSAPSTRLARARKLRDLKAQLKDLEPEN